MPSKPRSSAEPAATHCCAGRYDGPVLARFDSCRQRLRLSQAWHASQLGRTRGIEVADEGLEPQARWVNSMVAARESLFGHLLEGHAVDLAGGVQRHLGEEHDLFRRLVTDALAGKADKLSARGLFRVFLERYVR